MGAGFIIYKEKPLKILTLISSSKKGKVVYDLPKGSKEPGETPLETAIRECREEINIFVPPDKVEDVIVLSPRDLYLFIVRWEPSFEPRILPDPKSGRSEHVGWTWLPPRGFEMRCPNWMTEVSTEFERWYYTSLH